MSCTYTHVCTDFLTARGRRSTLRYQFVSTIDSLPKEEEEDLLMDGGSSFSVIRRTKSLLRSNLSEAVDLIIPLSLPGPTSEDPTL